MPNGMSGCFTLTKPELAERLLSRMPSEEIGYTLRLQPSTEGQRQVPARTPARAATVLELLQDFRGNEVFVEEQDRRCYIIHLDSEDHLDGSKWLTVAEDSPLFRFLRERHHSTGANW